MKENLKNIIFEKYFENGNIGMLIVKHNKIEYINNSFIELMKIFDLDLRGVTPLDLYYNYEVFLEKYPDLIELKDIIDYIKIFQNSNSNMSFKSLKNLKGKYLEFDIEGIIVDNEKHYLISISDITNEIKLLNYKYLEISRKISEISFKELSQNNVDSKKIFEKIYKVLKEYDIIEEMAIATLKNKNKIYFEFGIIDEIDITGNEMLRSDKSLISYIIDTHKKIYILNSLNYELPDGYKIYHIGSKPKPYSVYGVPLVDEKNIVYGAILYERPKSNKFAKLEITLLNEITYAIQSVIKFKDLYKKLYYEKEKYYEISIKDHLTKAYNRVFMEEYLKKAYDKIKRYDENIVICFIDIDDFKTINDRYGHDYGDMCLTMFSEVVFNNIRKSDVFSRYGGDEFIIVFPNTTIKEAEVIMERIRKLLKISEIKLEISYGLKVIDKTKSLKENLKEVDNLMYKMKNK
ncbi:hypothetical protein JCM30566_08040 [Marinitoga arctica]